jgi:hypothetical protein
VTGEISVSVGVAAEGRLHEVTININNRLIVKNLYRIVSPWIIQCTVRIGAIISVSQGPDAAAPAARISRVDRRACSIGFSGNVDPRFDAAIRIY